MFEYFLSEVFYEHVCRNKGLAVKSFSTKSDIFNWSVVRSQQSDVLRLRGGTGSPSPSPPPTRPTSPAQVPAALEVSPETVVSIIRPVAPIRSRSNLRRTEDLSPVRRHTAPTQASDLPRSRRETSVVTKKQVAVEKSRLICSKCGKDFNTERGMLVHETYHCPKRSQVNDRKYEIPSHEELGIDDSVCRICDKILSQKKTRIHHERTQHKLEITRGQSLSPVPCRHQSCPTSSRMSVSGITPPASRGSSSRRNLFPDTSPPVPMSLPTSSTSQISVDSSQSLQSQDESLDVPKTFCMSCNHEFSASTHYNSHQPCRFEVNDETLAKNPPALKLCPPLDRANVPKILQHLAESDFVDLCISQNWCCQGVWPLVFVGPVRSGSNLLSKYTAHQRSIDILKRYLSVRKMITIPRCIILEDQNNGIKSLLTGQLLLPPSNGFDTITTDDSYIVTKSQQAGGGGDGGGDDDSSSSDEDEESHDENEDSEDFDEDDVITHSHQPQPQMFAAQGTFQAIQHLLPHAGPGAFDPGVDGEGKIIKKIKSLEY